MVEELVLLWQFVRAVAALASSQGAGVMWAATARGAKQLGRRLIGGGLLVGALGAIVWAASRRRSPPIELAPPLTASPPGSPVNPPVASTDREVPAAQRNTAQPRRWKAGHRFINNYVVRAFRPVGSRLAPVVRLIGLWPSGVQAGLLAALGFMIGLITHRVGLNSLPTAEQGFMETSQFAIWATLIALQPALWGAATPWLWRTNHELRRLKKPSPRLRLLGILGWLTFSIVIFRALTLLPPSPDIPDTFITRNRILLVLADVSIFLPLVTSMWLIQAVLGDLGTTLDNAPREKESRSIVWSPLGRKIFGELQRLRVVLQNLLLIAGVIIGAVTLATGALRLAVLAWRPKADLPPEGPLLYGGFFTVILAFLYVPAYTSLQRRAHELINACWPLPTIKAPDEAWYTSRQNAETALGLTTSVKDSFQTGAAILAPLLTSVVTVLLPTKSG